MAIVNRIAPSVVKLDFSILYAPSEPAPVPYATIRTLVDIANMDAYPIGTVPLSTRLTFKISRLEIYPMTTPWYMRSALWRTRPNLQSFHILLSRRTVLRRQCWMISVHCPSLTASDCQALEARFMTRLRELGEDPAEGGRKAQEARTAESGRGRVEPALWLQLESLERLIRLNCISTSPIAGLRRLWLASSSNREIASRVMNRRVTS